MFLQDDNYKRLAQALEEGDVDAAFVAAHTLKGVCQNLSLDHLFEADVAVTEALRGKNLTEARENFPRVKEEYEKVVNRIEKLG